MGKSFCGHWNFEIDQCLCFVQLRGLQRLQEAFLAQKLRGLGPSLPKSPEGRRVKGDPSFSL